MSRGNAYVKLGQPQRAIEDLHEAIRLDPQFALGYYNRGNTYLSPNPPKEGLGDSP